MKIQRFKTTIKCSGCVATVTPVLNEKLGKNNWEVDLQSPERVLTIASAEDVSEMDIAAALEKIGFKAEKIN
ncbi:MAG: heavy metal transport/detoxification protein [Bacteroidetes bacterium]|nr:heavy metal transport/detoxification protein [Bacteroidota bacterium]